MRTYNKHNRSVKKQFAKIRNKHIEDKRRIRRFWELISVGCNGAYDLFWYLIDNPDLTSE